MKKTVLSILILLAVAILTACAPSAASIERAMAQTQTAQPSLTPTDVILSNATPKPQYIVEFGSCVRSAEANGPIGGNPTGRQGCMVSQRTQVSLGRGEEIQFTAKDNPALLYCSLYRLDGTFIMAKIERQGGLTVTCHP